MALSGPEVDFFWENRGQKARSRFNLLLLEHGEYFFEDVSVYYYPEFPSEILNSSAVHRAASMKYQGRLKICSRSLIFEPLDMKKPLLRFAYKNMVMPEPPGTSARTSSSKFPISSVRAVFANPSIDSEIFNGANITPEVTSSISRILSDESSGFFVFTCPTYLEIKLNDKIGPYKQMDQPPPSDRMLFSLLHSDISPFLNRIKELQFIIFLRNCEGKLKAEQALSSIVNKQSTIVFDTSKLLDFHENLLLKQPMLVKNVKPLVLHPGAIMITDKRVYFQPAQLNNIGDSFHVFDINKIARMYKRRYMLRQTGLEIVMKDGTSALFAFDTNTARDTAYQTITSQSNMTQSIISIKEMVHKWQQGEVSNYQYLMFLNNEADRSMHDLTQYPVFPHVLTDYSSKSLNLDNPAIFRDLSKPVGALNKERLTNFLERFHNMPPADLDLGVPPPFIYGTHYSTPGYVLYYLVRVAPEHMLCLQNGKFDAADRMFFSLKEMWESCLSNAADLKELIPEFFIGNGDFLSNSDDLELGYRHTGERLHDVELPPWAKSPKDFIRKMGKALESEYVSANLHNWIDLIFGYKQQGKEAVEANNLYYYITYEGSVDIDKVKDPIQRNALEVQIQEFGQTPKQLFVGPHPPRNDLKNIHQLPVLLKQTNEKTINEKPTAEIGGSHIRFTEGDKVEGNYRGRDRWYPGKISRDRGDGTYDISYNDGESEMRVPEVMIRRPNSHSNSSNSSNNSLRPDSLKDDLRYVNTSTTISSSSSTSNSNNNSNSSNSISSNSNSNSNSSSSSSSSMASSQSPTLPTSTVSGIFSKGLDLANKGISLIGTKTGWLNGGGASGSSKTSNNTNINNVNSNSIRIGSGNDSTDNSMKSTIGNDSKAFSPSPTIADDFEESLPPSLLANKGINNCSSETIDDKRLNQNSNNSSQLSDTSKKTFSTSTLFRPIRVTLNPSNPYQAHTDLVTGVSVASFNASEASSNPNNANVIISTCSKDSLIKVVLSTINDSSYADSSSISIQSHRTFSGTDPPLTSCFLTSDKRSVFAASWDNSIHSYSLPNARALNRHNSHDDCVSSMSYCSATNTVVSGSHDGSVKLWALKNSVISSKPINEWFDHENPIACVAITKDGCYVAAGAVDGRVIVWDVSDGSETLSYYVSKANRSITSLAWVDFEDSAHNSSLFRVGFTGVKLLCSSKDGTIICLDLNNRLYAAAQLDAGVLCACGDGVTVFGGCDDGTLRVWIMEGGVLRECTRFSRAHDGPITAIDICRNDERERKKNSTLAVSGGGNKAYRTLITAGESGFIRLWAVTIE